MTELANGVDTPESDSEFDAQHGTDTAGSVEPGDLGIGNAESRTLAIRYLPSPLRVTSWMLERIGVDPREYSLVDLGVARGILQVDVYAGYRRLVERGDVKLAFCWAQMRRNFYELATPGPAPIASEALERIAEFYAIEHIRGRSAEERRVIRQQKSRPLAEAIRYALSRWDGLTRFTDDGRIELDNNTVERSIRPIALNRQNALFAGSDAAPNIGPPSHP